MDWKRFVEGTSVVEKALRSDPAGTYDKMDFATRDRYRHAVESIAKRSLLTEEDVANKAANLARESATARVSTIEVRMLASICRQGPALSGERGGFEPVLNRVLQQYHAQVPSALLYRRHSSYYCIIMITVLTHALPLDHSDGCKSWLLFCW